MDNKIYKLLFTVPNLITLTRIFLIPVFLIMLVQHKRLEALVVFFIAASTDFLDGIAARFLKQKSNLGTLLDPAGDKLLLTAAVIALSFPSLGSPNSIPVWLTLAIIARDLYIVTGALVLYKRIGQKTFPPTLSGKISTVGQMGVILLVLFCNTRNISPPCVSWLFFLTFAFTLLSGIHYTLIGYRLNKKSGN